MVQWEQDLKVNIQGWLHLKRIWWWDTAENREARMQNKSMYKHIQGQLEARINH